MSLLGLLKLREKSLRCLAHYFDVFSGIRQLFLLLDLGVMRKRRDFERSSRNDTNRLDNSGYAGPKTQQTNYGRIARYDSQSWVCWL